MEEVVLVLLPTAVDKGCDCRCCCCCCCCGSGEFVSEVVNIVVAKSVVAAARVQLRYLVRQKKRSDFRCPRDLERRFIIACCPTWSLGLANFLVFDVAFDIINRLTLFAADFRRL